MMSAKTIKHEEPWINGLGRSNGVRTVGDRECGGIERTNLDSNRIKFSGASIYGSH